MDIVNSAKFIFKTLNKLRNLSSNLQIILFGGFRSSGVRYNDVWILDTVSEEWSQPHAGVDEYVHAE